MNRRRLSLFVGLLASSLITTAAWGQSLVLSATLHERGRRLMVKVTYASTPRCTLTLLGGRGEELTSASVEGGETHFAATALLPVRRTRSPVTYSLQAALRCEGAAEVRSESVTVRIDRRGGGRFVDSSRAWAQRLRRRAAPISLSLAAHPSLTFSKPLFVTDAGDGSRRLFVVEQDGFIRMLPHGFESETATLFLDLSHKVSVSAERGLLGLAFSPRFRTDRALYVNYTRAADGATVISRLTVQRDDPTSVDPTSEREILTIEQPFSNHNGGMLEFGPDGYLYIGTGDGGSRGDPHGNGQRRDTLLGKMLRIDVSKIPYAVPPDNPFVGSDGVREEIYALGFRNPWRYSFDRATRRLYVADVGQSAREEVSLVTKGGNYGWNVMEGDICYPPGTPCDQSQFAAPLVSYGRDVGGTVIGGYVYRGTLVPALRGLYLYGDFVSGRLFSLYHEGDHRIIVPLADTDLLLSSFGTDRNGEIYFTSYGDGKLFRVLK